MTNHREGTVMLPDCEKPDYAKEAQVLRQTLEAIFRGVWVGEDAIHDIQAFARNGLPPRGTRPRRDCKKRGGVIHAAAFAIGAVIAAALVGLVVLVSRNETLGNAFFVTCGLVNSYLIGRIALYFLGWRS